MYEHFTERARHVMELANKEAYRLNHHYIGTEHILLGFIKEGNGIGANALKNLDTDLQKIRLEVEKIVQAGPDMVAEGRLPVTPRAKKVIEYAIAESRGMNTNYIGTEHLLLGMFREQEGVAAQVLTNMGLKLETVRKEIVRILNPATFVVPEESDEEEEVPEPSVRIMHRIKLCPKKFGIDQSLEEMIRVRFQLPENVEITTVTVGTRPK